MDLLLIGKEEGRELVALGMKMSNFSDWKRIATGKVTAHNNDVF